MFCTLYLDTSIFFNYFIGRKSLFDFFSIYGYCDHLLIISFHIYMNYFNRIIEWINFLIPFHAFIKQYFEPQNSIPSKALAIPTLDTRLNREKEKWRKELKS